MLNCGLPFITIFNRMSKVVVDWSITNPCYLLNQFDAKLKATTVWRFAFSHACSSLHILCSCHLSAEGNPLINFTYLTSPSDWFRKLVLPSQPISYKTRTKRDLVIRVFPRLTRSYTGINFELSLASFSGFHLCSYWLLRLLWFLAFT